MSSLSEVAEILAPVDARGPSTERKRGFESPQDVLPELSLRVIPGADVDEAVVTTGAAVVPPPLEPKESLSLLPDLSDMSLGGSPVVGRARDSSKSIAPDKMREDYLVQRWPS